MPQDKVTQIVARMYGYGRGSVFTPKDFLDLVSYDNAQKTLVRLARQEKIRRLMRGVYEYPAYSKVLDGPASPNPDAVARAIARSYGWTILPSGDTALNLVGLSTQLPAAWEYYSDGPTKTYKWRTDSGGGTLAFRHRATKDVTKLSPKTALLVQALKTLGEKNVSPLTIAKLRATFDTRQRKRAVREARYATSWVYEIIKELAREN